MNNLRKITLLFGSLVVFLASCVKEDPVTVEFKSSEYQLAVGQTLDLAKELAVSNSAEKPVFTVSDEAVASVDAEGLLRALAAGEATVTAGVEGVAATSRIVVSAGIKADSLKLYAPQKLMAGGVAGTVKAEVSPKDYDLKNLEWTFTAVPETFTFQKDSVSAAEFRLTFPTYVEGGKVTVKVKDRISGLSKSAEVAVTEEPIGADKVTLIGAGSLTAMEGLWTSVTAKVEPSGYDMKNLEWEFTPSIESLKYKAEKVSDSEYKVSFLNYVENGSLTVMVTDTVSQVFGKHDVKVLEFPKDGVSEINIHPETLQLYEGDEPVELTVTHDPVFYDPALLEWKSSNEKVVSVKDGVVTVVGVGEAKVTVTDIVSKKHEDCEVTVSVPVTDAVIKSISFKNTEDLKGMKAGGGSVQLIAICKDESGNVVENYADLVWEAPVEKIIDGELEREVVVVEVSQRGVVTPMNYGITTITVSDKKNGAVYASCSVAVAEADLVAGSVLLDKEVINLKKGQTETLNAITDPAGVAVKFESSDKAVATVEGNHVTAVGNGEAVITATADGGVKATCKVIVADAWVKLSDTAITLVERKSKTLTATIEPEDQPVKTIEWKSEDENVATVDKNGKITAVKQGETVITASASGCAGAACRVIVEKTAAEFSIILSIPDENVRNNGLQQDKTVRLQAIYRRLDNTEYAPAEKSWWIKSEDSQVAKVDQEGNVTAIIDQIEKSGKENGRGITIYHLADGVQEEISLTVVKAKPESVRFTKVPDGYVMNDGERFRFEAEVLPAKASQEIRWQLTPQSDRNPDLDGYGNIEYYGDGTFEAVTPGDVILHAYAGDSDNLEVRASVRIEIKEVPVENFVIEGSDSYAVKVGDSFFLETGITPENASYQTITWTAEPSEIVSVDSDGKVTALAEGEGVVKGVLQGGKEVNCNVSVAAQSGLNVGDYYYSDGTWSTEYDSDKTVVGIVFSTQNPTLQDSGLPGTCINGLAVALEEVESIAWQTSGTESDVSKWLSDNKGYGNLTSTRRACGYSNTNGLKEYNKMNPGNEVHVAGREPSTALPSGASGWYVPSYEEMQRIISSYTVIRAKLEEAEGTPFSTEESYNIPQKDGSTLDGYRYWTSTESDNSVEWACAFQFHDNSDRRKGHVNARKESDHYRVRYIFAF